VPGESNVQSRGARLRRACNEEVGQGHGFS
jgi:hypothetical protein